jgi:nicotinamide phosphoribosyltransferase
MNNNNIIELSDSYKVTHWRQYPTGTESVFAYYESRKGALFDETVFFGLQAIIQKYLVGQVVTQEKIDEAAKLFAVHFGNDAIFNRAGWEHILKEHNGYLPIRIKAIPEGTPVQVSNVLMTVENLDPKCYWLTNYLETLLCQVWYPCTVATMSREIKKIIKHYLTMTSDNLGGLNFMLHDFGFRGVSSVESAGLGGAAHLVNFLGTDTLAAMDTAMEYYDAPLAGLAFSVPATEHSVMTARGPEDEARVVGDLIKTYPKGILSVVCDSYDYVNFVKNILGVQFKDAILAREGVLVVRPDSGDPEEVTLKVVELLGDAFGYTRNSKGYKVLNPKVRVLWGDGIDIRGIRGILGMLDVNNWSAENIACFGCGGGLLQKVNRDTLRFAFKCSAQKRDGAWHDIYKNPLDRSKTSKRGRLSLVKVGTEFMTVPERENGDLLQTVFENGKLIKRYTFAEVRANAELK